MILEVSPKEFARIREQAMRDETLGIDPGKRWKELYPQEMEIEFRVVPSASDASAP